MKRSLLLVGCVTMILVLILGRTLIQPRHTYAQEGQPPAASGEKKVEVVKTAPFVVVKDPSTAEELIDSRELKLGSMRIIQKMSSLEASAPDLADYVQVTLKVPSEVEFQKLESLLKGLLQVQIKPRLRLVLGGSSQPRAELKKAGKASVEDLKAVADYLKQQQDVPIAADEIKTDVDSKVASTTEPPASANTEQSRSTSAEAQRAPTLPTDAKEFPFRISLLTLKGDWLDVPNAEEIQQDLRTGLADSGISGELLGGLPRSGAKIFFSQDTISTYAPEKFAQLNAWLASKKLVVSQTPLTLKLMGYVSDPRPGQVPSPAEKREPGSLAPWSLGIDQQPQAETDAAVYQAVLEMDPTPLKLNLPRIADEPLLARRNKVTYRITLIRRASNKTTFARIDRDIFVEEKPRGGNPRNAMNLQSDWFAFQIPQQTVVLVNAFAADTSGSRTSNLPWDAHELEPVLVFEDHPQLDASHKVAPAVALPDRAAAIDRDRVSWTGVRAPVSNSESTLTASTRDASDIVPAEPPNSRRRKNNRTGAARNDESGTITNAYDLKYVDPETALETVKKLMPPVHVATVNAGNLKKLIVSGDPSTLEKVKELIRILDAPAPTTSAANSGTSSVSNQQLPARSPASDHNKPVAVAELDQLRRAADSLESRTLELANEIRELRAKPSPDAQQTIKLERELTKAVAEAFRSRQELLQTEVASLQQRAQGIQRSIETRNRVAKQIVDRRMADLLNPDFNWEATEVKTRPASPPASALKSAPKASSTESKRRYVTDPGAAVAWIELTTAKRDAAGTVQRQVKYSNGTAVSSDGLVAFIMDAGMPEQTAFQLFESCLVSLYEQSTQVRPAQLVAYDSATGLGLLQVIGDHVLYAEPVDVTAAVGRKLAYYVRPEQRASTQDRLCHITDTVADSSANRLTYLVTCFREIHQPGAPLVDSGRRLVGILGKMQVPPSNPMPPGAVSPATGDTRDRTPISFAISSHDILALIAQYRQRTSTAGDPLAPPAQHPDIDNLSPGTTSVVRTPTKSEQVTLHATLLEIDTSASKELFGRVIQTNAPTMLAIPKDFDSRLKEIAKTANVQIVTKPTIETSLNQSTLLEISQTVPANGAQPDNPTGKAVDVQLEFFPTRRADSALQLELSAKIADGTVAPHVQLAGSVRLPTTNVQNFRVVLGMPAEKEVLFVCPAYRPDAPRMLLLRVQFEVPGVISSPDPPAPTATVQQTPVVAVNGENGPVLRNAAQFRKLLDDTTTKLNEAQQTIDGMLAAFREEKPESQLDDVKKVHPKLFDHLERARRDQQLARDELDAQIKLLQIELQDGESELAAATLKYKSTNDLYEKKVVSQAERDLERRSVEQAQNRTKKAKVLLDLYQKIDPPQPKDVPGVDR